MRKRADRGDREDKFAAFRKVRKAFGEFRPAREVLKRVSAVRTRFLQFDHATGVGGLPIERVSVVHGPSGQGKTAFTLGLEESFLQLGHLVYHVDAERTTPITWAEKLMGDLADHPCYFAARPETYEETVEAVRRFATTIGEQRAKGVISEDTSGLIVVDSIKKLIPKGLWDQLQKDVLKNGIDGAGGRAGQWKAALNSQWMDELVPLMDDARTAIVIIARETDDSEAGKWTKLAGDDYKVNGGKAIIYDSSMVLRVQRDKYVTAANEEGERAPVYGERHRVTIHKTKVSGQEEKKTLCYFHTSNGTFAPFGFDRARDVLDLGTRFGVVEQRGAWFSFEDQRLGQGMHNAVSALAGDVGRLAQVEAAVRARFESENPIQVTDDGEVM
jgi:recombination protein RecA